jgi:Trypsin-like peptidase domain
MRVPADYRKCVAYLCADVLDEDSGAVLREPCGTAFFVSVPLDDGLGYQVYAVTARHVIDASRRYGQIFFRMNKAAGGFEDVAAPGQDEWHMHLTTDVAVVAISIPGELEYAAIGWASFVRDEIAERFDVGEGDEVILIGLFTPHPGTSRSEPVMRFGQIARKPFDPISVKMDPSPNADRASVPAYLVEATAWGGQSGSPALLYLAPDRQPGKIVIGADGGGDIGLLGLVHGHYPHRQLIPLGDEETTAVADLNAGISVVIPAQDIYDLLDSDEIASERRDLVNRLHQ